MLLGDHVRQLPPLVVNGDVAHLGWWARFFWRAEAEVVEDLVDGKLVGDVGNDLEGSPAVAVLRSILLHLIDRRFEESRLIVITR